MLATDEEFSHCSLAADKDVCRPTLLTVDKDAGWCSLAADEEAGRPARAAKDEVGRPALPHSIFGCTIRSLERCR